jgi:REP element-mobilizing transposase RayT
MPHNDGVSSSSKISNPEGPRHLIWYHNGTLPHFDNVGVTQAITFRLADSLPRAVLKRIDLETARLITDDNEEIARERQSRLEAALDICHGSCILRHFDNAVIVRDALTHFHGKRYALHAWVIMPNHVHALIQQQEGGILSTIVRSWKGYTAKKIQSGGRLWQRDYWDRYIRNEEHFRKCIEYIHANPVKAKLVQNVADWPWSSAASAKTLAMGK